MGVRQRKSSNRGKNKQRNHDETSKESVQNKSREKGQPSEETKRHLFSETSISFLAVVVLVSVAALWLVVNTFLPTQQLESTVDIPESSESVKPPSTTETTLDSSLSNDDTAKVDEPPVKVGSYELLETVPHDRKAFTQGLQLHNGILYESTGLYGESQVRIVDIATGDVTRRTPLDQAYFGEGLSYYTTQDGTARLILLTWKEQTGFLLDPVSLEILESFDYSTTTTEGWGITYRAETNEFLVTDGSQYLHTWDADTLQETAKLPVTLLQRGMLEPMEVKLLNELEWNVHRNDLLANVWFQDAILRIDVTTGRATNVYNLATLYPNRSPGDDVLNGIAVTETPNEVWVTGKLWPNMYRIRLID